MAEKELTIEIRKPEILFLISALLIVFIGFPPFVKIFYELPSWLNKIEVLGELYVSLKSPIAFGDEGYHTRMAQHIAQEKDYVAWTPFIGLGGSGFGRAPLWNLLEASFYFIFGFHEFIVKFLTPFISSILTGLAVFVLIRRIYDKEIGIISSLIVVTIPSIVTYSVLFYTDTLFTFYFGMFTMLLILAFKKEGKKYWMLSGIFGAFSLLTKTPGLATLPIIGLCFLYRLYKTKKINETIKEFLILGIPIILILGGFFIRSFVHYKTPYCGLPFSGDMCKIESGYKPIYQEEASKKADQAGTSMNIFNIGIINYLQFAYGNIWFVPLTLLCGIIVIIFRKKPSDILILLVLVSFLPVASRSLYGRAEDLSRYMLGVAPLFACMAANYWKEIHDFIKTHFKQFGFILFIAIAIFCLMNLNEKLKTMMQVKRFSPAFFEACDWAKENLPEDAHIGQSTWAFPTIYNCQRTVGGGGPDVEYSNNLTLALSALKVQEVTHIFIQKFSIDWQNRKLNEKTMASFLDFMESNPEQFKKIYENGPPLDACRQAGGCDGNLLYEVNFTGIDLIPL